MSRAPRVLTVTLVLLHLGPWHLVNVVVSIATGSCPMLRMTTDWFGHLTESPRYRHQLSDVLLSSGSRVRIQVDLAGQVELQLQRQGSQDVTLSLSDLTAIVEALECAQDVSRQQCWNPWIVVAEATKRYSLSDTERGRRAS